MPPKLVSDDGRHAVIRPLAYVAEKDLRLGPVPRIPDHSVHCAAPQRNLQRKAGRGRCCAMGA